MPRSAISTGLVDAVLPLAGIPGALAAPASQGPPTPPSAEVGPRLTPRQLVPTPVSDIIALLYARNGRDFAPYKRGTLEPRIERRMGLASLGNDLGRYLDLLRTDANELDQLARDLLIHVTRFFREPAVFDTLASLIPAMLQGRSPDDPVRVWIAGCSTGEEAYSLVMLFREAIEAAQAAVESQTSNARTSNCRFSHPTSTPTPWPWRGRDYTRPASPPMSPRTDWRGSSTRRTITATGCIPICGRRSCSRCRICWSTRRSRAWTSCPAAMS